VLAMVLGVVAVQALMLAAFAWPASRVGPREVPLVVAGPGTNDFIEQLEDIPGPDEDAQAFTVTELDDPAAAEQALRDREAYGAIVVDDGGAQLLISSAASPTVAQLLQQSLLGPAEGVVVDVVPAAEDDPRGTGFAASLLPLVATGIAAGAAIFFLAGSLRERIGALFAYAVLSGLTATGVMHWLGILEGSYFATAAVVAALALAVAAPVAGLGAVLGPAGIGVGVLVILFFGNAFSGIATAPDLLPQPWGEVGQWVPPGAGGTLLRSVAFFDGADSVRSWLVLAIWAVAGLAILVVGQLLGRRHDIAPEESTPAAA